MTANLYRATWDSPLGEIVLAANETALVGLWFAGQKHFPRGVDDGNFERGQKRGAGDEAPASQENAILCQTKAWLSAYFRGENPDPHAIPLESNGTDFQKKVWQILTEIPYGTTLTYGEIAKKFSAKMSAQAIGMAVAKNPISLIVPCHRVVGAKNLTGYAGGLEKKKFLLQLEQGARP